MSQKIIAFTGISGVGKTTFLKKLAKTVSFQHLSGGSLIASARQAGADQRDAMRHADLDENQQLLIDGFFAVCDPQVELVILDGHVVIDGGNNLNELPSTVFRALGVSLMVHLEANSDQVAANRSLDTSRSRPTYASEALDQHQSTSRNHAASIACELGIGFQIVTHSDVDEFATMLSALKQP